MLRTIVISVLMLITFGAILPFDESEAYGIRQSAVVKRHHYRKHSRAWWRRYRARLRRRRAAAAMAAHRRAMMAVGLPQPTPIGYAPPTPTSPRLPVGWDNVSAANTTEMKFRTSTDNATAPGQATLTVVAQSRPMPSYLSVREQRRMLAGVSVTDLRRIVIDKMLSAGGWVTNDFQRDVNGHRVFVVTAQTPSDARTPEKSWNFYFTEIDGRVYSLTTNTPREFSERMANEAETFISSLHANSSAASQTPGNK
ncbi:MAG TPA: hypothetical protein VJM12_21980 [Pyrinomonadaceae bacterium]|nr:hypothetical protein [Pyrinomonadaceae bacterium]